MKKLRKALLVVIAGSAVTCAALGFAACTADGGEHFHRYGDWVVTEPTNETAGSATKTCTVEGCEEPPVTVTLPVLGDASYAKANDTATCTAGGEATYVYTKDNITISFVAATPAKGHSGLTKTEKKKSCTEDGIAPYWTCGECGMKFSDENATVAIEHPIVIPAGHFAPEYKAAKEATCDTKGVQAHWECAVCHEVLFDEDGTTPITEDDLEVYPENPDKHKPLEHMQGQSATCTIKGFEEYWYCPGCLAKFSDADGEHKIDKPVEIAFSHGAMIKVDGKAATCGEDGIADSWKCEDCGQMFADAAGTQKIGKAAVIPATGNHQLEAKAGTDFVASITFPTGTSFNAGNNDYWQCSTCNKMFADETGKTEITNPGKYVSRGGGAVLFEGNNVMCLSSGSQISLYFQPEESACYGFKISGCTFARLNYFGEAADTNNGVTVYNLGWYGTSKYINNFVKNNPQQDAKDTDGFVYADMNKDDVVNIIVTGITAKQTFGIEVIKMEFDENKNNLFVGTTDVTVSESEANGGIEYVFTAPQDDFYKISASSGSAAYIMLVKSGVKEMVVSPMDEAGSYIFKANKGETFTFFMGAVTLDDVTFPAAYAVTIEMGVEYPTIAIGEVNSLNFAAGGPGSLALGAIVCAEEAGTYNLEIQASPGIGRNTYYLSVNGGPDIMLSYNNGKIQAEIVLGEGVNEITIKNGGPASAANGLPVTIVPKAE